MRGLEGHGRGGFWHVGVNKQYVGKVKERKKGGKGEREDGMFIHNF